jgi:hypothetical protein
MLKRNWLHIIAPLVLIQVVLLLSLRSDNKAQQAEIRDKSKPTFLNRAIKEEGWQIPQVTAFTILIQRSEKKVEDVEVVEKAYQANPSKPLFNLDGYYLNSDGGLIINTTTNAVHDLQSYEVKGKIFAYRVDLVPVTIQDDGTRVYMGAMYSVNYVDEDGDGKYETRYGSLNPPKLPEWVKMLSKMAKTKL